MPQGQKQPLCSSAYSSSHRCLPSLPAIAACHRCLLSLALGDLGLLGAVEQHDGGRRDALGIASGSAPLDSGVQGENPAGKPDGRSDRWTSSRPLSLTFRVVLCWAGPCPSLLQLSQSPAEISLTYF